MWGAFIAILIAAAGVLIIAGPIAGLVVTAFGSAVLLCASLVLDQQRTAVQIASGLAVVDGGARQTEELEFPPLQEQAS